MPQKNPIQPLIIDDHGVVRFKENSIVRYILDNGGIDLNKIAVLKFSNEDREQFAQLIGYSLSGFGELSYVSDSTYETAERMWKDGLTEKDARILVLEEKLGYLGESLREPMAMLFGVHPDDLNRQ